MPARVKPLQIPPNMTNTEKMIMVIQRIVINRGLFPLFRFTVLLFPFSAFLPLWSFGIISSLIHMHIRIDMAAIAITINSGRRRTRCSIEKNCCSEV